jgi:predicted TIM-barrel fold metal-dependent hydrolase
VQLTAVPISADSHVVEPAEVFAGLAKRFGDAAPRIALTEDGESMVIPGRGRRGVPVARPGVAGFRLGELRAEHAPGRKPHPEDPLDPQVRSLFSRGYAGVRRAILDPRERPADQDVDGVAAEVLYPSLYLGLFGLESPELLAACFASYNDWLADFCAQSPGRLYGLALIPLSDPEAGRRELERALRRGFRGGCIPCTAPHGTLYADPVYDPIWSRAAEAGFPLSMHIGTDAWRPPRHAPDWLGSIAGYAGAVATIQATLADLICGGVAHRFPELRLVCAEWNAGWIANWLDRLDQGFERVRTAAVDYLDRRPSEYWHRQFYATLEDDRAGVLTRELCGVRALLWGNDYPHRDSTWPCSKSVLERLFAGVPERDRDAIARSNVTSLYRLA